MLRLRRRRARREQLDQKPPEELDDVVDAELRRSSSIFEGVLVVLACDIIDEDDE